jgi:predicted glycoside hydrolase/deacetylase ChbG (UPF0249 family)
VNLEAVRAEAVAQIELCEKNGLTLTHCDSHHYIHGLGELGATIGEVASEASIPLIRASRWRSLATPVASAVMLGKLRLPPSSDAGGGPTACRRYPSPASDYVIPLGLPAVGPLPYALLARVLGAMSGSVVEIVAHPGYDDYELSRCSNYVAERRKELSVLAGGTVHALLERHGLQPTTFRELAGS